MLFGFGLFALVLVSVCMVLVLLVLYILPNEKRGNWCRVQEGQQWYLKAWKSFIEHHGTPLERITGEGWRRLYGVDRLVSIACNVSVLSTSLQCKVRTANWQWGVLKLQWKQLFGVDRLVSFLQLPTVCSLAVFFWTVFTPLCNSVKTVVWCRSFSELRSLAVSAVTTDGVELSPKPPSSKPHKHATIFACGFQIQSQQHS